MLLTQKWFLARFYQYRLEPFSAAALDREIPLEFGLTGMEQARDHRPAERPLPLRASQAHNSRVLEIDHRSLRIPGKQRTGQPTEEGQMPYQHQRVLLGSQPFG